MRQWAIDVVGPERWDQLLAVIAVGLIVLIPLCALISGLGLWPRLPWSRDDEELKSLGSGVEDSSAVDGGGASD